VVSEVITSVWSILVFGETVRRHPRRGPNRQSNFLNSHDGLAAPSLLGNGGLAEFDHGYVVEVENLVPANCYFLLPTSNAVGATWGVRVAS
jgi:hypothetical protein